MNRISGARNGLLNYGNGVSPHRPEHRQAIIALILYQPGVPNKGLLRQPATGNDLRYQATITRTARDCTRTGSDITARIGILGRVITGPAGNPPTIEIPLRVAVVKGGVSETTIATKVYRTTVTMDETGSVPFSLVAEDLVYPAPAGAEGDSYIFYIGFDPQALTPEPAPRAPKKKKKQAAPPPS